MSNYRLVACDTDSIKFCNEDGSPMTREEMDAILDKMNAAVPKGILLEPDGYYPGFLVIKSKNYVTFDGKKFKYRGSSIVDAKKEPALQNLMKDLIHELMGNNNKSILIEIFNKYCIEAVKPKDINHWTTKKTITDAIFNSPRLNERKILDACNYAIERGVLGGIQEGDKVWFYQAINGSTPVLDKYGNPKVSKNGTVKTEENKVLRVPELYNNDHDVWHYVKRCWDSVKILSNIIDIDMFPKYHLKTNREKLEKLIREHS